MSGTNAGMASARDGRLARPDGGPVKWTWQGGVIETKKHRGVGPVPASTTEE
jgi:hypothetical protein